MDYMHYQRYPDIHGDMEPAFVVGPHEPCCPDEQDECVCVTSGDVERWNDAADMLSALSGVTPEDIEKIDEVLTSATLWNGTYETVSANSGNWNKTFDAVTANSATWNKASAIPEITSDINNLASSLSALEDVTEGKQDKIYFDGTSIIGDGTLGSPYRVYDWARIAKINDDVKFFRNHVLERTVSSDGDSDGKPATYMITDGAAAYINKVDPQLEVLNSFMLNLDTNLSGLKDEVIDAKTMANRAISEAKTYWGDGDTIIVEPKYPEDINTREFVISLIGLPSGVNADIKKGLQAYEWAYALHQRHLLDWAEASRPTSDAGAKVYKDPNTIYVC